MSDNWADLETYSCRTCRFYVPKQVLGETRVVPGGVYKEGTVGRCRRHAPTMNGYPVVYQSDWCGDHKMGTNPSRRASEGGS